jgi:hypothetical protein
MDHRTEGTTQRGPGHEVRDIQLRPIVWAGIALVVVAIVAHIGVWRLFDYFTERRTRVESRPTPTAPLAWPRQTPPGPRLQADPHKDLEALLGAQDALLQSYGWVDREAGVARIPIARAMALLAERGLPVRQGDGSPPGGAR